MDSMPDTAQPTPENIHGGWGAVLTAMNWANAEQRAMHHVTPTSTVCGARRGLDRPQGETPQGRCGADAVRPSG